MRSSAGVGRHLCLRWLARRHRFCSAPWSRLSTQSLLVPLLDDPVPQAVEQLQDVLQFFDRLSAVPEPVIEVPKIYTEDVPMRAVLRATQLAEQLVEVPTIISNLLLLLLQALLEHKQRTVEQNVDIPVVGGIEAGGGLFGFPAGDSSSMTAEQIVDNPVPRPGGAGVFKVYTVDRVQRRFRSRSLNFPIKIFSQSRAPQRLPRISLDKLVKGFLALFPGRQKVRRSRAPRDRNRVRSRAHGRRELSWFLYRGTTWGAAFPPCC